MATPASKNYTHTEMVDGHPITYNKLFRDRDAGVDDSLISEQPPEIQNTVFKWINNGLRPRKAELRNRTSYGLKHVLQLETGIYLSNNAFKDAMLQCGYEPVDYFPLNWKYRLSKRSPAFKDDDGRYHDGKHFDWLN